MQAVHGIDAVPSSQRAAISLPVGLARRVENDRIAQIAQIPLRGCDGYSALFPQISPTQLLSAFNLTCEPFLAVLGCGFPPFSRLGVMTAMSPLTVSVSGRKASYNSLTPGVVGSRAEALMKLRERHVR